MLYRDYIGNIFPVPYEPPIKQIKSISAQVNAWQQPRWQSLHLCERCFSNMVQILWLHGSCPQTGHKMIQRKIWFLLSHLPLPIVISPSRWRTYPISGTIGISWLPNWGFGTNLSSTIRLSSSSQGRRVA